MSAALPAEPGDLRTEVFLAFCRRLIALVDAHSPLVRQRELSIDGQHGGEAIQLRAVAWQGGGFRWARLVEIHGDRGTFALNLCFFPRSAAPLPLWSSEYLALRGRLHLLILDALDLDDTQPAWSPGHLARVQARVQPAARAPIPPWAGEAMSSGCLFVRAPGPLPSLEVAHEGYASALGELLDLAGALPAGELPAPVAAGRRAAENRYHAAMSEHDPAVHYLRRALGETVAGELAREMLFPPCP